MLASSASSTAAVASLSLGNAATIASSVGRDSAAATSTASRAVAESALILSDASFWTLWGTGSGPRSPNSPLRLAKARAISIAKNGLPPDASATLAMIGRVGVLPSRSRRM